MALVENPLKQFGITLDRNPFRNLTPQEQIIERRKNLESYTTEVLADLPVSLLYHYWLSKDSNLFTDPTCQEKYLVDYQLDKRERNGLYRHGLSAVKRLTIDNPNHVVLWYSPKGPASFDHDPDNPYSQINYDYGQLYVQYFDGQKINAVALKVSDEKLLADQFPVFARALGLEDERNRIIQSVLKPKVLPFSIDEFFNRDWSDEKIYKDHSLAYVMNEARQIFGGRKITVISTSDIVSRNSYSFQQTEQQILQDFLLTINRYMVATGKTTHQLSGSCGGSTVTKDGIEDLLGIKDFIAEMNPLKELSNYGSLSRRQTQSEKKWDYHKGDCVIVEPDCGAKNVDVGPCGLCKKCEKKFD